MQFCSRKQDVETQLEIGYAKVLIAVQVLKDGPVLNFRSIFKLLKLFKITAYQVNIK